MFEIFCIFLGLTKRIEAIEKRLDSPTYGPMLQEDPDDVCS